MKVTSTVAYQAFTERNLTRRRLYWTMPWPIGIHEIPRRLLIDADEFGLHLNDANRKYGSAPRGMKVRKPGNYDRGTFKLTIILERLPRRNSAGSWTATKEAMWAASIGSDGLLVRA